MLKIKPQKIKAIADKIEQFQKKEHGYPKLTTEKDSPHTLSNPWRNL